MGRQARRIISPARAIGIETSYEVKACIVATDTVSFGIT